MRIIPLRWKRIQVHPDDGGWHANLKKTYNGVKLTFFKDGQTTLAEMQEIYCRAQRYWENASTPKPDASIQSSPPPAEVSYPNTPEVQEAGKKLHRAGLDEESIEKVLTALYSGRERKYPGLLLGDIPGYAEKLNGRMTELYEDWNAEEQYFILADNLTGVDWGKLIPYWNNAKIFTADGFLNFLDGHVEGNEDAAQVNRLLQQCHYFQAGYFKWPYTDVYPSENLLRAIDAPRIGVLRYMGYRVGNSGLDISERHKILERIFLEKLPFVDSMAYMNEWHTAATPFRLKKLANAIAGFTKVHKRQRNADACKTAILSWEEDLKWLKREYYDTMNFCFWWPTTGMNNHVGRRIYSCFFKYAER